MKKKLSNNQLKFIIILGLALGIRNLGMSLVAPFISNYTLELKYGTLALSGIALGGFSLTQSFFQVPFGRFCDRFGNKRIVLFGLALLICGLGLSTFSQNAYIYILSRFLQGTGAITAGVFAWIAKEIEDEKRADAMGLCSLIISFFIVVALGGGPLLILIWNVQELYAIATILVIVVFFLILFFLKDDRNENEIKLSKEEQAIKSKETSKYTISLLKNWKFVGFCFVGFIALFVYMSTFIIIPEYATQLVGEVNLWMVYTPAMLIGIASMKISVVFVKRSYSKQVAIIASLFFVFSGIILIFASNSLVFLIIGSALAFAAYFILTNLIPTATNHIVKPEYRGSLNGIVNAFTYIGGFFGSAITGFLWGINTKYAIVVIISLAILVTIIAFIAFPKLIMKNRNSADSENEIEIAVYKE